MRQLLASLLVMMLAASVARAEVVIPLALENGIPVAQLSIAGGTHPFTLDIGSSRTVHLTRDVMDTIPGLQLTGRKLKSLDLTGRIAEQDEFTIPDLVINGISFGAVTGVAFEPWGLHTGPGAAQPRHSVIGLGLFAQQPFVYDFAGAKLRFGAPLALGTGWRELPYEKVHEGIVVRLGNERASYRMVFDTAANVSVVKPASVQSRRDRTHRCDFLGPGKPCKYVAMSLAGGPVLTPLLLPMPERFEPDGLAGADFFQHYAVYVDQANGKVALRPAAR
ncbi:hypothetical protein IP91_04337 [Pseudoduganella lurida]|uniref:Aspartyl protease n=1 Tax=Pseudoduganella lurida TaxID=1036180 RepID=A0A562QZI8_9BURK|nr:hypothetical protein [Pseudoduganella lurida]TWI62228.1 hypothetical protein IP91_04337 [Pseudoduganella lurida]